MKKKKNKFEITSQVVCKILSVVDKGLSCGLGRPIPGNMCVEAAVCYAMGEPHGDHPKCVDDELREFKISINDDHSWTSKKSRARGLRKLAVAQLGSKGTINWKKCLDEMVKIVLKEHFAEVLVRAYHKVDEDERKYILKLAMMATNGNIAGMSKLNHNHSYYRTATVDNVSDIIKTLYVKSIKDAVKDIFELNNKLQNTRTSTIQRESALVAVCDVAVKALEKIKAPGCQFLYLCN